MTKQRLSVTLFSIAFSLSITVGAQAGTIVVTPTFDVSNQASAPDTTDYEGVFNDGTAAPYSISIGTFNFNIPAWDTVISASISGTFGDVNEPTSALADLFVLTNSIEVGGCDLNQDGSYPACAAGTDDGSLVPWSHNFTSDELTELAADLSAGSIDFTAVQNSAGAVVVGSPTLDLVVVAPEPASLFTFAGGLLVVAAFRRRK